MKDERSRIVSEVCPKKLIYTNHIVTLKFL
jgi:hypothetical protein